MANLKFYKGTESQVNIKNPALGSIWFNTEDRTINVRTLNGDGNLAWEKYTGLTNATFENGLLTITKAKGDALQLNLSDVASAKTLAEIADLVKGNADKNITGITEKISNLETATGANADAIKNINDTVIPTLATKEELAAEATERGKIAESVSTLSGTVESQGTAISDIQAIVGELTGEGTEGSSIADRIGAAITALDLPNTYEAKGAADTAKSTILGYGEEEIPATDATTVKGLNDRIDGVDERIEDALDAIETVDAKSYTVSKLTADEISALQDANVKEAYKLVYNDGENNSTAGEIIKIYKDSALQSVELVDADKDGNAGQFLKYVYSKADGSEEIVYVNVSEFLVQAEFDTNVFEISAAGNVALKAGNGISVTDGVAVKLDASSESFLTVGTDGLKLAGVQNAIDQKFGEIVIPDVTASGDELVNASAEGHAVTVSATEALTSAVTKANSAIQAADITTGSANGTIAVKGTDVAVKGLGSAAYTDATAYDAAGAAADAQAAAIAAVTGVADTAKAEDKTIEGVRKYAESLVENGLSWASFE